jgi:hypothetical protein
MNCSYTEKISSLIDGELAPAEAREVERHVLTCGECEQVKADFLSLRSQITGFETSLQPVVQNRELKRILSRGERAPARGLRWSWGTPAIAFAVLLVVGAIIGFVFYLTSKTDQQRPQQIAAVEPTPAPVPSPEPGKEEVEPEAAKPANRPAPSKKPLVREPKPGEQFATVTTPAPTPETLRAADTETLTALHFEKSERLLLAFRNVRLDTRGAAAEVAYERNRAQELVYQNMILRRQADANGEVHIASLLENLEPILLDIANLPEKQNKNAVRTIRDRVERKNIVMLLQVNSAALARALD